MAVDWKRHFGLIVWEISHAKAAWRRGNPGIPERLWLTTSAAWIIGVNRMLRSRHIPMAVRAETSSIPWQAIARLAEHVDKCRVGDIALPARVIEDLNARVAPALIDPLSELRDRLMMMDADGNGRDGVLDLNSDEAREHKPVRFGSGVRLEIYCRPIGNPVASNWKLKPVQLEAGANDATEQG